MLKKLRSMVIKMDDLTPEQRRKNMQHIRSTNTRPEEIVRKYFFSQGLRYRKNDKRFLGKPDLFFPKYKTAVFVNGCFWHTHDCGRFVWPKSNQEYWEKKIFRNVERDNENYAALQEEGWKVIIVWECELKTKEKAEERLELLRNEIVSNING